MKRILLAALCSQLTSCVMYDAYPYYYGSGYSTSYYNSSSHYYSAPTSYSSSYVCHRRPRNVEPLDGSPRSDLRGRVFRGGDGMWYVETSR